MIEPVILKHGEENDALLALTTIGFPNMMAAVGWIREVLDKEHS